VDFFSPSPLPLGCAPSEARTFDSLDFGADKASTFSLPSFFSPFFSLPLLCCRRSLRSRGGPPLFCPRRSHRSRRTFWRSFPFPPPFPLPLCWPKKWLRREPSGSWERFPPCSPPPFFYTSNEGHSMKGLPTPWRIKSAAVKKTRAFILSFFPLLLCTALNGVSRSLPHPGPVRSAWRT